MSMPCMSCVFVMLICGCLGFVFLFSLFVVCFIIIFCSQWNVFVIHFRDLFDDGFICIEFVLLSSSDRRWSNETENIMNATHQLMNQNTITAAVASSIHPFWHLLYLYYIQLIQIITNWIERYLSVLSRTWVFDSLSYLSIMSFLLIFFFFSQIDLLDHFYFLWLLDGYYSYKVSTLWCCYALSCIMTLCQTLACR